MNYEKVRELFDYQDGCLYWKERTDVPKEWNTRWAGKTAGRFCNGYSRVRVNYKQYMLHHLIYLWHTGVMPNQIDHKDRDPMNNRIENLRNVSQKFNMRNKTIDKRNKSGHTGVFYNNTNNKWRTFITDLDGNRITKTHNCYTSAVVHRKQQERVFGYGL